MEKQLEQLISVDSHMPAGIADKLSKTICVKKINASFSTKAILGILAGIYIAFGAALATLIGHDLAKYVGLGFSRFIIGGVFSVGLMLVVIAGAELFTGNNLMLMSVLDKQASFRKMLTRWGIVYIANFIGALFLAYLYFHTNLWKAGNMGVGLFALKIANAKVNLTFMEGFTRGILCNWLVCLAVWMSLSSRETAGKIFAIFFPIMAFVALGFEHCIANMYFIPMGLFLKGTGIAANAGLNLGNLTWANFFTKNLLPVTIGNVIGGAFFVGCLYWFVYIKPKTVDK